MALLWLAPWLVCQTPLRNQIANSLAGDLKGTIQIGSASTGWLSPIRLSDVTLIDPNGETLCTIESIETRKALLALATHPKSLGELSVSGGDVFVSLDESKFNWEHALEDILSAESSGAPLESLSVSLSDVDVHIREVNGKSQQTIQIEAAELTIASPTESMNGTIQLNRHVEVNDSENAANAGTLKLTLQESGSSDSLQWTMTVESERFALDALSTLLSRFVADIRVQGQLNGQGVLTAEPSGLLSLDFNEVSVTSCVLQSSTWIREDRLALEELYLNGNARWDGYIAQADSLEVKTDFGSIKAQGIFEPRAFSTTSPSIDELSDFSIEGNLDLAMLAEMLPNTLRMRDGITVENGSCTCIAFSRVEGGKRRLFLDVNIENIQGQSESQRFAFQQPIHLSMSAHAKDASFELEFFECKSEFMSFTGQGDANSGSVEGRADLSRLKQEIGQFIELGDYELAGNLTWASKWQLVDPLTGLPHSQVEVAPEQESEPSTDLRIDSNLQIQNARFQWSEGREIQESNINLIAAFLLDQTDNGLALSAGTLQAMTETDQCTIQLLEPLETSFTRPTSVHVDVSGELKTLLSHFGDYLPEGMSGTEGQLSMKGNAKLSGSFVEIIGAEYRVDHLQTSLAGLEIDEPQAQGQLHLIYDVTSGLLDLSRTTLQGNTISAVAEKFVYTSEEGASSLEASLAYRADAFRLSEWLPAMREQSYRPFGELSGTVLVGMDATTLSCELNGRGDQCAIGKRAPNINGGSQWQSTWSEEALTYVASVAYDLETTHLDLSRVELSSSALALGGSGRILRPFDDCFVELHGELTTDLQVMSVKLKPLLGDLITFAGQSSDSFMLQGSLFDRDPSIVSTGIVPASLTAQAATAFDQASVMGITTSAGRVVGRLENQKIHFEPLNVAVDSGYLRGSPVIRLDGEQPVLEISNERVLEGIRLTPEITRTWIAYGAPILAGATQAEGQFSVQIDQAAIPLTNPFAGTALGSLEVEHATLGPGPLGAQLISVISQVKSVVTGGRIDSSPSTQFAKMPPQTIRMQLVDGRIHHDRVILQIDDVTLVTAGSIGADQSLDMVVGFRIPQSWVAGRPIAASLADFEVRIPLRGQLGKPEIDRQVLQSLTRDFLQRAAGGVLENELKRGLQGLFGGSGQNP